MEKRCLREACESPVGLSMSDDPMGNVFIKRWSRLRGEVGWERVAYWLQRCERLLLPLLNSWSHLYGLLMYA